ncbi:STAS domain-containing protein [Peribacillus kribbensis]|uniref:STAS domain-containing protein n=1 Tax=Peribacillus kribbensis TaxID=356658 RepID=UPI00041D6AD1|nr:STAS domain-containing protein [Peribacillus kribbensis]
MITLAERNDMITYVTQNKSLFEERLLSKAVNVAGKIKEILDKGNIDLLHNAGKLVVYIIEQNGDDLIALGKKQGIAWAKHALTLHLKLEWVQAIRRTLWSFLEQYYSDNDKNLDFFILEKEFNDQVDKFLNTLVISYSNYKDELIKSQRQIVEHLSVPIIPISQSIAVLPLIGFMDSYRMHIIEEKVLNEISRLKIQTLVMDLSGIAEMDLEEIVHFQKILQGISMMGCKAVITGLRADLVRKMIHAGVSFENKAETKSTLQQTLQDYLSIEHLV